MYEGNLKSIKPDNTEFVRTVRDTSRQFYIADNNELSAMYEVI